MYGGCGFVAKLSFAAAADRLGPRPLLYISLLGFGCGMVCLTQASAGYWMIALGVGLIGLLGAALYLNINPKSERFPAYSKILRGIGEFFPLQ